MAIVERYRKNGKLVFQVKVRDPDGRWYPTPAFERMEDAKGEEARLLALKRKGARSITEDARKVSVGEYWEVWSIENRSEVSEGWKISQNQMFRDYVKPVIGSTKMIEVGAPEIGRILNRARELGLGDQTRKHIYSLLRKMFADSVEYYEMLARSPVQPKFHRPRVPKTKRRFLLPAQAFRLLEVARRHSYLGPAVWTMTLSALRISEVQGLMGAAVQFELGQILIQQIYNNKVGALQPYPKQEDWAYVPMAPMLADYLRELDRRPKEFVIQGPAGGMLAYETFLPALKRLCRSAEVPEVTPHELRHTCTEIYYQAGAGTEDIRRLLNHASLSATMNYIHRTDERLQKLSGNLFPSSFPPGNKEAERVLAQESHNVH